MTASIDKVLQDIRQGKPIIIVDDGADSNQGALFIAAECVTGEAINFMMNHGRGPVCAILTQDWLEEMALFRSLGISGTGKDFIASLDANGAPGASAAGKALTIGKLLDSNATAAEFSVPGNVLLMKAVKGGVLRKAGKAEAAADLATIAGLAPVGVLCDILNPDGAMAEMKDLAALADAQTLQIVTIEDLIAYRRERDTYVTLEAEASLPTAYGTFRMAGFVNRLNGEHHIALVKGDISPEDKVLVRVHSECLTGDAFHSLKCDCGEQLASALSAIEKEGSGILLYLRQEGRGIGLINKIKAYKLQEQGLDTEEANLALGFPSDMRDYGIGAQILSALNVRMLRLMTNNPKKLIGIKGHGIEVVERVPLIIAPNPINKRYFQTKEEKMGHLFR